MLTIIKEIHTASEPFGTQALCLLFLFVFSASAWGQNAATLQNETNKPAAALTSTSAAPLPLTSIYKDVKIGTDADEVRKLLGKAKIDDKDGFFYDEESELVQIRLDENTKVRLISVTYPSNSPSAPKYSDLFGGESIEAKPDGSVYRLVRYPEAGYWIAYSKTGGDRPTVTVTMQKL